MQSRYEEPASLAKEIQLLCQEKLSVRVPSVEQNLFESGLLDSLLLVQLIFELERHFQMELPLDELDITSLTSIEAMAGLIARRKLASAASNPKVLNQLAG